MAKTTRIFSTDLFDQENIVRDMFRLTAVNMAAAAGLTPQFGDEEKDLQLWIKFSKDDALNRQLKTVVVYDGKTLCGYMQYYRVNDDTCFWSEIQIAQPYKRDGVTLRLLCGGFFNDADYADCKSIETYINDKNDNSWSLALHARFTETEKSARGHKYTCERAKLARWEKLCKKR